MQPVRGFPVTRQLANDTVQDECTLKTLLLSVYCDKHTSDNDADIHCPKHTTDNDADTHCRKHTTDNDADTHCRKHASDNDADTVTNTPVTMMLALSQTHL